MTASRGGECITGGAEGGGWCRVYMATGDVRPGCSRAYAMPTLRLDLPAEVFSALRRWPEEFGRELRLAAAIHWYQRDRLSQEMAAQVAGLDRTDFLMALVRRGVDAFSVDFEDLERELARG
jgi:predicted HTH domain antitoxin